MKLVPGFALVALILALQRLYGGFEFHYDRTEEIAGKE